MLNDSEHKIKYGEKLAIQTAFSVAIVAGFSLLLWAVVTRLAGVVVGPI